jgi:hypothetical protein
VYRARRALSRLRIAARGRWADLNATTNAVLRIPVERLDIDNPGQQDHENSVLYEWLYRAKHAVLRANLWTLSVVPDARRTSAADHYPGPETVELRGIELNGEQGGRFSAWLNACRRFFGPGPRYTVRMDGGVRAAGRLLGHVGREATSFRPEDRVRVIVRSLDFGEDVDAEDWARVVAPLALNLLAFLPAALLEVDLRQIQGESDAAVLLDAASPGATSALRAAVDAEGARRGSGPDPTTASRVLRRWEDGAITVRAGLRTYVDEYR